MGSTDFYLRNSTQMTSCGLTLDWSRWHGQSSEYARRWRCSPVKTSKRRSDSLSPLGWELESALLNSNPHRSVSGASGFLKRSADAVLSFVGLILLAPLFAIIALVVHLSD